MNSRPEIGDVLNDDHDFKDHSDDVATIVADFKPDGDDFSCPGRDF